VHDHQPTTHLLHKFGYQRRSRETWSYKGLLFIRNCAPKSSDFEEKNLKITISCTLSCPSRSIKTRKLCRLYYIDRQTNTPFMILYIFRCIISVVLETNTHTNHHFLVKCIITILGLLVASNIAKLLHTYYEYTRKLKKTYR
jgi:hypothetical protein